MHIYIHTGLKFPILRSKMISWCALLICTRIMRVHKVCMYVRTYVCMYGLCMYVCMYVWALHVCMHVCMGFVCMYACMYGLCIYVCMCRLCMYVCENDLMMHPTNLYPDIEGAQGKYVCVCVCMYVCMGFVCMYVGPRKLYANN